MSSQLMTSNKSLYKQLKKKFSELFSLYIKSFKFLIYENLLNCKQNNTRFFTIMFILTLIKF